MEARVIDLHTRKRISSGRAVPSAEGSALSELRRARLRIAQLEKSLTEAMRDNLKNFNRARDAERKLKDLEALDMV